MASIVGAYATSPASAAWKEAEETAYYDGLKAMAGVRGLEVPFTGTLHPHDEAWLLKALKKDWDFVVTCIPGTMQTLVKDKTFGLASDDAAGRKAAIDFARKAKDAVARINAAVGRNAVIAVEVHQNSRTDGRAVFDLALDPLVPTETNAPTRPEVSSPTRTDYSVSLEIGRAHV